VYLIKEVPLVDGKLEHRQILVAVAVAQLSKNGKRRKNGHETINDLGIDSFASAFLLLSSLGG
jgi:hypothetical protein